VLLVVAVIMAVHLISPIRMFALKFKGFGWKGNEIRYIFLLACVAIIAVLTRMAIPAIIGLDVAISTIRWGVNRKKEQE
jgi:CDP-diacylglycerol--serine O-phosphatidyltransferase